MNRKRVVGTILRALAGLAVLVIVLTRVPLASLAERLGNIRATDAAALVLIAIVQMELGALRWYRLFARVGEKVSPWPITRDVLVGMLFNTFLPTSFGGDIIRAVRAGRRVKASYHAWSTSLFERLVGMLSQAIIGAIGALLALGSALTLGQKGAIVLVILAFVLAMFFAAAPLRILVRIMEKRLPATFIENVRGVVADLEGPLATPGARLETLGWSFLQFALTIGFSIYGAHALGADGHAVALIVGVPAVGVLAMAPISLGGHGLREGLFVIVLGMLGVEKDVALGIAVLALAYNITGALAGGVVAMIEPTPPVKTAEAA
ncbi:MAG: lysylphosphatidylglycerol synthase transmembrane domain-containing protein [Labilithrix sp.]